MARTAPRPQVMAQVLQQKARLQLAQNQLSQAERWAADSGLDIAHLPDHSAEPAYLTLLRVSLAQEDQTSLRAAVEVMTGLLQQSEAQQRRGRAIEILIVQALTYQFLGRIEEALTALEQAMAMAAPEGYVRRFVDEGQPLAELLARTRTEENRMSQYVIKLRAAFKIGQRSVSEHQPLVEPLTERELEILSLIAAGLSNKAIAETLFITVGTVKRHTTNIYGKLGVNSRTQATAKAKALKLIE